MKTFTKRLFALITAAFLFASCGEDKGVTTVNPIITISQGNGNCKLVLSGDIDNGTTKTKGNNVVTWVRGQGVGEIVSIFKKSGDDVFVVKPMRQHPNDPESDWFGVTKNTLDKLTEEYGIIWNDEDGNSCTHDPTLKINQ